MKHFVCRYCKKIFTGKTGSVPCPNCGHRKPCSGHRIVGTKELEVLRRDYPQAFNKDKPNERPRGGDIR